VKDESQAAKKPTTAISSRKSSKKDDSIPSPRGCLSWWPLAVISLNSSNHPRSASRLILRSLALSRLVSSFLFGVSATDPLIYILSVLIMMIMALLASTLPASRAASANPIDALRSS
jgi:hypothetical protein